MVKQDRALRVTTEPTVVVNPRTNDRISISALPGQTELQIDGGYVPFLGFSNGELVMRYAPSLNNEQNAVRRKTAEVANRLGAIITHDAGDEILKW